MSQDMGLRERKKRRTREALITAAMGLFRSQGYEQTTVAQIAAAAEVSVRTFFLHFPAKEDLVMAEVSERVALGVRVFEQPLPGEHLTDLLLRAVNQMITHTGDTDLVSGVAYSRVQLIVSVPDLQARMLRRLAEAQALIADALRRAYPEALDPIAAAAVVGSVVGAVTAAAAVSVSREDPPERVVAAMRRAAGLAVGDFRALIGQ
ncbi:TetR/AcrR family transcriptional regulator [Nonomuraea dietziae]|uniref:AcrR family transcriptional regulator n=1 Tax=Nonomuraea dietziae TaxID=65515 RepID=A0A7W5V258_9ACTN|nr:TetR/AcrR family transcriptional regulator [Nonomuraea dietziae]MBB3726215.1 AcrR family transcriptional regulator [Nonomuraea dietziae]